MRVKIKDFKIDMDVKASGIEFEVRTADDASQLGDCYLTMTGLVWCQGRKGRASGVKVSWAEFIDIMSTSDSLKAAIKAAREI